jgi:hypothetical protein
MEKNRLSLQLQAYMVVHWLELEQHAPRRHRGAL